jgi:hypothetical protein
MRQVLTAFDKDGIAVLSADEFQTVSDVLDYLQARVIERGDEVPRHEVELGMELGKIVGRIKGD